MIADLRLMLIVHEVNKEWSVMSTRKVMQYQATRARFPRFFSWFGAGSWVRDNRCENSKYLDISHLTEFITVLDVGF